MNINRWYKFKTKCEFEDYGGQSPWGWDIRYSSSDSVDNGEIFFVLDILDEENEGEFHHVKVPTIDGKVETFWIRHDEYKFLC